MPLLYILSSILEWLVHQGVNLAIVTICAMLIPRAGRLVKRLLTSRLEESEESKAKLALLGTMVYIAQAVVYFVLLVWGLKQIGFSMAGAAIPATVVSAALGFGAQGLIADFLAGFFILSEKQFGVGDWVRFKGSNLDVEGDVIQITMRATRIRTLQGETVIVPNGAAKVCINNSNYWSRAVVKIPVPLLGSQSVYDAIARSEKAARVALAKPGIAEIVTGELDVHPGVGVEKPTTVGMPWMIDMRFLCQATPGNHWAVERAIRTSILQEFWDEYGSATTTAGTVRDQLLPSPRTSDFGAVRTTEPRFDVPIDQLPPTELTSAPATEVIATHGREEKGNAESSRADVSVEHPPTSVMPEPEAAASDEQEVHSHRLFREDHHNGPLMNLFTLGGRVRASSTGLLVLLCMLLMVRATTVQTSEAWENGEGYLAPAPKTTSQTTSSPAASEVDETSGAPSTTRTEPTRQNQTGTNAATSTATTAPTHERHQQPTPTADRGVETQNQPTSQPTHGSRATGNPVEPQPATEQPGGGTGGGVGGGGNTGTLGDGAEPSRGGLY